MEWKPIESAPVCVCSSPGDSGKRPVIVTRHPITGSHHPMAIARLTSSGWISGKMGKKLWFEPTHWMPLPNPPRE
jgi:homoserine acetyltransferase